MLRILALAVVTFLVCALSAASGQQTCSRTWSGANNVPNTFYRFATNNVLPSSDDSYYSANISRAVPLFGTSYRNVWVSQVFCL